MERSEKELRRVAEQVVVLLPDTEADARHVCDLAMQLKRWEDGAPIDDSGGAGRVSILRRE